MDTLTREQRDILLDYYFQCADQHESDVAKDLLATHEGAMEFYNRLNHSLSPLEHLEHEAYASCPDHLVEKTLDALYAHHSASSGTDGLEKLLRAESEKVVTKRPSFWRNLYEAAAIAAAVAVFSGLFVPVTRHMRAQAWQTACQANLAQVSQGIAEYASDNQNYLPAVNTKAGNPWWKVGSTQPENQSNTRHIWLLVKQNYVQPELFICPGGKSKNMPMLERARIATLPDFPDRRYISYSFKLICEPSKAKMSGTKTPLMSDVNPIFQACIKDPYCFSRSQFDPVKLNEKLLRINSSSHRGRGQNIMFSDGTVKFTSQRVFGPNDDIFTAKGHDTYTGTETPSSDTDVFLVP